MKYRTISLSTGGVSGGLCGTGGSGGAGSCRADGGDAGGHVGGACGDTCGGTCGSDGASGGGGVVFIVVDIVIVVVCGVGAGVEFVLWRPADVDDDGGRHDGAVDAGHAVVRALHGERRLLRGAGHGRQPPEPPAEQPDGRRRRPGHLHGTGLVPAAAATAAAAAVGQRQWRRLVLFLVVVLGS